MKQWSSHDMAVEEGGRMSDDDRQWKRWQSAGKKKPVDDVTVTDGRVVVDKFERRRTEAPVASVSA
jgi:hypothetical protein